MELTEQGYLDVEGARLEFRRWGAADSDTTTLVLLHEGLGCVAMWRDFPGELAAATGLSVFAYSRAGYGGSDACALPRPLDYMEREARDVLPKLVDAAGIKSMILVGHSDGASIAAIYAGSAKDHRLKALTLIAPHFFTEPPGLAAIAKAREAFETGDLRARLMRHHGANVDCAFRGWNDAWLDPGFESWNIERFLDTIEVPVLAIQGRDDEYGTMRQLEVVSKRCARAQTLVFDACGHAPHQQHSKAVVAAITGFTSQLK